MPIHIDKQWFFILNSIFSEMEWTRMMDARDQHWSIRLLVQLKVHEWSLLSSICIFLCQRKIIFVHTNIITVYMYMLKHLSASTNI